MYGDKWVLILLDTHNEVVDQVSVLQESKEDTLSDLIEHYDEIFERSMEEGNECESNKYDGVL